jgi:hypothetical protein
LSDFFVFNAGDDAVAFPRLQKSRQRFGQAALDVEHAPPPMRSHVSGHAQKTASSIRARAFNEQHDPLAISHNENSDLARKVCRKA